MRSEKPKIFIIWAFTRKTCWPLVSIEWYCWCQVIMENVVNMWWGMEEVKCSHPLQTWLQRKRKNLVGCWKYSSCRVKVFVCSCLCVLLMGNKSSYLEHDKIMAFLSLHKRKAFKIQEWTKKFVSEVMGKANPEAPGLSVKLEAKTSAEAWRGGTHLRSLKEEVKCLSKMAKEI